MLRGKIRHLKNRFWSSYCPYIQVNYTMVLLSMITLQDEPPFLILARLFVPFLANYDEQHSVKYLLISGHCWKIKTVKKDKNTITLLFQTFWVDRRLWQAKVNSRLPESKLELTRVCITVSNSPNPSRVYIRLCKHEKRVRLLK